MLRFVLVAFLLPFALAQEQVGQRASAGFLLFDVSLEGQLHRLNPYTGQASAFASLPSGWAPSSGLTYIPSENRLYLLATNGQEAALMAINPQTGQLSNQVAVPGGKGLAYHDGLLYTTMGDNFYGPVRLYALDPQTGQESNLVTLQVGQEYGLLTNLAFDTSGKLWLSFNNDGDPSVLAVADLKTGAVVPRLNFAGARALTFEPFYGTLFWIEDDEDGNNTLYNSNGKVGRAGAPTAVGLTFCPTRASWDD